MSAEDSITLDDIELMIEVLERFVKLSRRATRVLSGLRHSVGGGYSGMQGDFMQMLMRQAIQSKMGATEELEEVVVDEDVKQLLEKVRKRKRKK